MSAAEPVRMARRDASFLNSPGTSRRYHVIATGGGVAACDSNMLLVDDDGGTAPEHVPPVLRCGRPACRVS